MHYERWRVHGDPLKVLISPPGQARHSDGQGYIVISDPLRPGRIILEHRAVMEAHLDRGLVKGENVHHINGIRTDNSLENLELWNVSQPPGQRHEDLVSWAKNLLRRLGYTIARTPDSTSRASDAPS